MKNLLFISVICSAFLMSCNSISNNKTDDKDSAQSGELNLHVIKIDDFEQFAADFVDREIQIEGTVSHVCKHGGKKLFIFKAPNDSVSVKITTNETFAPELEGSDIIVKGIVRELRITEEDIIAMENEACEAENHGEENVEGKHHEAANEVTMEYRKMLDECGEDHLSFYSIECIEFKEKK